MRNFATFGVLMLAVSCGPNHGTALEKDTPCGKATFYYTENVDAELAGKVFQAMVDGNYNFGKELVVQLDKVAERLTLRTCHDNIEMIDDVAKNGEKDGNVSHMRGLANHISKSIDNQEVDIILHRLTLADPFFTVKWQAPPK